MAILRVEDGDRTEFPAGLLPRWLLYGVAALAGGELVFALISGVLDNYGQVGELAGHLPTLFALGAAVTSAQRRALNLKFNWAAAVFCGAGTTAAYAAGFIFLGPPMDFLLSIIVIGLISGLTLWLTLRPRLTGALWCLPAVGLGYALGAGLGTAAAIAFGGRVDHLFGGGVTGFMGVVGMIGIVAGVTGSLLSGVALARIVSPASSADLSATGPVS